MVKKIINYTIGLVIIYFVLVWLKYEYDVQADFGEITKVEVTEITKGDYGSSWDLTFDSRMTVSNEDIGFLYYDYMFEDNVPEAVQVGDSLVITAVRYENHSWMDFFKFGSRYDYYIMDTYVNGEGENLSTHELYVREKTKELSATENWLLIIAWIAIFILWAILVGIIKKKVYKNGAEKNGKWIFNKPAWLEFISGVIYTIFAVSMGWLSFTYFSAGNYFVGAFGGGMCIYNAFQLLKEFWNRNSEVVLSSNEIMVNDSGRIKTFPMNQVEKIQFLYLAEDSSSSSKKRELQMALTGSFDKKDEGRDKVSKPGEYNLDDMGIAGFGTAIITKSRELYTDLVSVDEVKKKEENKEGEKKEEGKGEAE